MDRKNIYIVEDEEDIGEMLKFAFNEFSDFPVEIFTYSNATDFLLQVENQLPDIIIMDVQLPDGNGLALCAQLKSETKTKAIPIILMSANRLPLKVWQRAKAVEFLNKPFDLLYLLNKTKAVLGYKSLL